MTEEAPGGSACLKHSKHSKHSQHSQHSQSSKDLERRPKSAPICGGCCSDKCVFLFFRRILGDDEMYNYRDVLHEMLISTPSCTCRDLRDFEGDGVSTHLAPSKNRKDLR